MPKAVHWAAIACALVVFGTGLGAVLSPWTRGSYAGTGTSSNIDMHLSLWGQRISVPGRDSTFRSWSNILESASPDDAYCRGEGPSNSDALWHIRIAQIGSVVGAVFSAVLLVLIALYAFNKVSRRSRWALIAVLFTALAGAAAAFFAYASFFSLCDKTQCEYFVDNRGAFTSATCGPTTGIFLIGAAGLFFLAAAILTFVRKPHRIVEEEAAMALTANGAGAGIAADGQPVYGAANGGGYGNAHGNGGYGQPPPPPPGHQAYYGQAPGPYGYPQQQQPEYQPKTAAGGV